MLGILILMFNITARAFACFSCTDSIDAKHSAACSRNQLLSMNANQEVQYCKRWLAAVKWNKATRIHVISLLTKDSNRGLARLATSSPTLS